MIRNTATLFFSVLSQNIFAASIAVNMFSTTILLITLTFLGHSEMAADVAIVQGATHAVFMAFSANARNLILGSNTNNALIQQFFFRFYSLIPLSLIAYLLSNTIVEISSLVIAILIFRRCNEWIAELQVTEREKNDDRQYAHRFFYIQLVSLLALVSSLVLEDGSYYKAFLLIWAIAPIVQLAPFLVRVYRLRSQGSRLDLREFLPHVGSSWVIAISVYVFRVLIVLLVGRSVGGILFSAYAIGGMLNSLYTFALGPSQVFNKQSETGYSRFINIAVALLVVTGTGLSIFSYIADTGAANSYFFHKSIGFSMIGGGIMILAQQRRIYMLQVFNTSVFVQDVVANILIVSTLPIAFSIFGIEALPAIFLWNALLTYVIYLLTASGSGYDKWRSNSLIPQIENRQIIQAVILFLLFLPVFFQLNGGVFNSSQMFFESYGGLTRLPLPLASVVSFVGIALLINYQVTRMSAAVIFVFFVAMLMTTFILYAITDSDLAIGKLILLIQFILPVFALILGQSYQKPTEPWLFFESIFLYMLIIIVPLQVIATLVQQTGMLTPYLYYFSIYQHLQYVPTIFVGGYLIALYSLYDNKATKKILVVLAPFMIAYVVLSQSLLAIIVLAVGLFIATLLLLKQYQIRTISLLIAIFALAYSYSSIPELKPELSFAMNYNIVNIASGNELPQTTIQDKSFLAIFEEQIYFWKWHIQGITENLQTFVLGHIRRPERSVIPSAQNYYLDLLYNFGLLALLPLIYLVIYTIKLYRANYQNGRLQYNTIGLAVIVFFFILIDNSTKVSFRQPYSGIIIFFLWGVLLSRLSIKTNTKKS